MVNHEELGHAGSVPHWALEQRLAGTETLLDQLLPQGTYGVDDMLVAPSSARLPASSAPTWNDWKTTLQLLDFGASGGEYMHITTQFSHRYAYGTNIVYHVHFIPRTQMTNGQTVQFRLTYVMADRTAAYGSTATVDVTYTASGTVAADTHCMTTETSIGSFSSASGIVVARLERLSADTFGGTVGLLSSDFHFRADKMGT